jgi:hypothetical protein
MVPMPTYKGGSEMKETEKMMFLIRQINEMKISIKESMDETVYLRGKLSAYEHAYEEMFEREIGNETQIKLMENKQ